MHGEPSRSRVPREMTVLFEAAFRDSGKGAHGKGIAVAVRAHSGTYFPCGFFGEAFFPSATEGVAEFVRQGALEQVLERLLVFQQQFGGSARAGGEERLLQQRHTIKHGRNARTGDVEPQALQQRLPVGGEDQNPLPRAEIIAVIRRKQIVDHGQFLAALGLREVNRATKALAVFPEHFDKVQRRGMFLGGACGRKERATDD